MIRRMLINAQRAEELRIAVVSDTTLDQYQVAVAEAGLVRGNIYRGTVASIQPALDAAFLDFGLPKHGFLACDDVMPQAYHRQPAGGKRARIDTVLERGRPIIVQATKDPTGEKGAALTTNVSLAGRYLVLMPFDEVRGISRKVEDEAVRAQVREQASKLDIPEGYGFIVRTNGLDQSKTTLNRDLAGLLRLWKRIQTDAGHGKGPRLLYSDQDLIVQAIRDHLDASIGEVLVDDDAAFEKASAAMRAFMPRSKTKLIRYRERLPLFSKFTLETQIESIFKPAVPLSSGGSIVIEGTEALTAIDVNSGRSTRGANQEETAFATNLEAAREVARQLRLRDIGGLIVVDFIDMRAGKHRREVEKVLRDALRVDKARVATEHISANGLLEINRQRIKKPLVMRTHRVCPTCGGGGKIPSPETVSVTLLRRIEERAAMGGIQAVHVALHPELADAFQNHYRQEIAGLEREFDIRIEIIAGTGLHRVDEKIEWVQGRPVEAPPAPKEGETADVLDLTRERPRQAARAEAATESAAPKPAAEAEPRAKKRRRGGRRHKKAALTGAEPLVEPTAPEPAAAAAPPVVAVAPEAPAAQPTAPTGDGEAGAGAATTRRRRGGRRRGRAGGSVEKGAGLVPTLGEAHEPSSPPEQPIVTSAPETGGEGTSAGGSGEAAKKRRRRRRKTSRPPAEGGTTDSGLA